MNKNLQRQRPEHLTKYEWRKLLASLLMSPDKDFVQVQTDDGWTQERFVK